MVQSDSNLFAGTRDSGIFVSSDNGAHWKPVESDSAGSLMSVSSFAVSGTNIMAGTIGYWIFVSTNNGTSWSKANSGLSDSQINKVVCSGTLTFAATQDSGVFVSMDFGSMWKRCSTGLPPKPITTLAACGTALIAGTSGAGAFRSTDDGATWIASDSGLAKSYVGSMIVIGTNLVAGVIDYPLGKASVFLSTDSGSSWTEVNNAIPTTYVNAFAVSGTYLFAGTDSGVWKRPLSELITAVTPGPNRTPNRYQLDQNYPNPFNPSTNIRYGVPERAHVTLTVFSALGQQVATLINGVQEAGFHTVRFDASGLASGVYFYMLRGGEFATVKRLVVIR